MLLIMERISIKDLQFLEKKGISQDTLKWQLDKFAKGFPFIKLNKPATLNDGIISFDSKVALELLSAYDLVTKGKSKVKFVPASGAATRMFKDLYYFADNYKKNASDPKLKEGYKFIENIEKLSFFNLLKDSVNSKFGIVISKDNALEFYKEIIVCLLTETGLNYGSLPKGMIEFHSYEESTRKALEEHIVEGIKYAKDGDNVRLHFTVSPEHFNQIKVFIDSVLIHYENEFNVKITVDYSVQKTSTDTIAIDNKNNIVREKDGNIYLRPSGHGALIENLNELDGDIIFIKNIDNIVPDRLKEETIFYKKLLGLYLINVQQFISVFLKLLKSEDYDYSNLGDISEFCLSKLSIKFNKDYYSLTDKDKRNVLIKKLNRPIRLCGMVKNVGEPGGGPFWVEDEKGDISLQIVESSQVNMADPKQKELFNNSTHFNPVDLVCYIKDYEGNKFDLRKFVDNETGFITSKSKDGIDIKALELPGLWNGAMADWITIFVEVPLSTFNPVKTVNDLLREEHS